MSLSNTKLLEATLFNCSIGTTIFLSLLYLNHTIIKSDYVLIGVFQELLTFPCVFAQPVLMILAGRSFDLNGYKILSHPFATILISTTTFLLLARAFLNL